MSATEFNRTLSQASQNVTPFKWGELPHYSALPPVPVSCQTSANTTSYFGPRTSVRYAPLTNGLYRPNIRLQSSHITLDGSYIRHVHNGSGILTGINALNNQMQSANPVPQPWMNTTTRKNTGAIRKPKRIRTTFTSNQMMELEQEYARTRYLDRTRRFELADSLHLHERTIKIWYQNRRMKEKKDRAESLDDSEATCTTDSSTELDNGVQTLMHEQIPDLNDVYHHGGPYLEQYDPSSTPNCVPPLAMPTMPQSPKSSLTYPVFTPEQYEPQYQQVHFPMQHCPPAYDCDGIEGITIETLPQSDNQDPVPNTNTFDQNWDLSWIQSMNLSEV